MWAANLNVVIENHAVLFQNPPSALIVNNNNSSSSSSSASASAAGPTAPAPAPAAPVPPPTVSPPRTLTRTGFDSLGLAGLAALLIVLGFMMLHHSAAVAPALATHGKPPRSGTRGRSLGHGRTLGRRRRRR